MKKGQTDCLRRALANAAAGLALLASLAARASGQTNETSGAFWPTANLYTQLAPSVRLLVFGELKRDGDFPYQQGDIGAGLGYRWKSFTQPHLASIDPDKEYFLVTAAGYEFLRTIQSGPELHEDRIAVEATPRFRPPENFLIADRNRIEFRWVDGNYSTRYRNQLRVEHDFLVHDLRVDPYASAEFFYDITKGSWSEEQYAAGIQIPYRRLLMVDLYYLRQNCDTCRPEHVNVLGLTINVYLNAGK
ncbi:MAG TPA: DUF2490 domain-containing protein [Thermoanaerobaculia bacterium]|nr:DUF2490 domain-containing protein [Thermoanaerobaculia bacterium]